MRLAAARTLVDAAIAHAEGLGARATVCVLDAGANVVLQARMDGAALMGLQIAHDKARTAVGLDMPSGALQEHLQRERSSTASPRRGCSRSAAGSPSTRTACSSARSA